MASEFICVIDGRQVHWDRRSGSIYLRKPGLLGGEWKKLPMQAASRSMAQSIAYDWLRSRR